MRGCRHAKGEPGRTAFFQNGGQAIDGRRCNAQSPHQSGRTFHLMPLRQEKHEPCRAVRRFHLVGTGATSGQEQT